MNDDRIGRMLDAIYDQRAVIWGELVGRAARAYELDLSRLHADTFSEHFHVFGFGLLVWNCHPAQVCGSTSCLSFRVAANAVAVGNALS